jgi:peptide/nickel transport system substrate-binding protein
LPDPANGPTDWSRRDFLRMGTLAAGAVALGPTLAACGSSSGRTGPQSGNAVKFSGGPATDGTPKHGGTLTVGVLSNGTSETISVPGTLNEPDFVRVFNLYDPMFFQAPGGKTKAALVESAEPNADATVWNLKVRQGVEWHDGKPLTADDIVYTIQHSWGSKKNLFAGALSQVVDFAQTKKTGTHEVQVVLKHGIALFPTLTCFPNCLVVQDGTTNFNNGIGTGPFTLKSFTPGSRSVFAANKNYWVEGQPYVDQLVVDSSFSSEDARMNALLGGQIDVVPNPPSTLAKANATAGKIVVGNQPGPGFDPIIMRVDKGALSNPDLRRALKLIPDRQQYVDTAFNGYATIGNDLGGYTDQYFASDIKATHDPDKAKSILKKAGLENPTLTLATSAAFPGMNETAALFARQAKAAGVTIKLNTIDPSTFFTAAAAVFERPFATSYYSIGVNSIAVFYIATGLRGGIYNECHFGSTKDDALIFNALKETNEAKAKTLWHDVQVRQADEGGYLVPANFNYVDAYSKSVRGVQTTSAMQCDNFNFKTAWLDRTSS